MTIDKKTAHESLELVVETFKGLRAELLESFGNIEHTNKADKTQVTKLDVKVEGTLRNVLEDKYPDFGFQGEETGKHGVLEQYWLVDPIDGTSSFIRGLPFCTNMAALVDDGEVVAAVIYDFVRDVVYSAIKGEGAFLNGSKIEVNNSREAGNLFLYTLSGLSFETTKLELRKLGVRSYLPAGAAGFCYMMLAAGRIDGVAVFDSATAVHDNAPGILIAKEAGAELMRFDGESGLEVSDFVIGVPKVIEAVESVIT
jgi:fructose-1,6-bisphosphatase/inositol monophosphatase family enzyme